MSTTKLLSHCLLVSVFIGLNLAATAICRAQPTQAELMQMQNQLKEMQAKLGWAPPTAEESLSARVKSVGHLNKPSAQLQPIPESLSIRLYDVSDIFAVSPQYPAMRVNEFTGESLPFFRNEAGQRMAGGGQGGGSFNVPSKLASRAQFSEALSMQSVRVSIEALTEAITSTVEPEKWAEMDGNSTIQVLGNTLLISATDSMHAQIASLLDLFREHWGHLRTVSVTAYWIKSNPTELAPLLQSAEGTNKGVGLVETEKWSKFLLDMVDANRVAYSVTVNGHSGQTLHTVSGRERAVVVGGEEIESTITDSKSETSETKVIGFSPNIARFHEGAALQVTPLATRGGNFLILDLHTRVTELLNQHAEQIKPALFVVGEDGNKAELPIERGDYISYRLSTTIRCPKDRVVLAGGLTYDRTGADKSPNLYLFVRTNIHTIEEDVSDRKIE